MMYIRSSRLMTLLSSPRSQMHPVDLTNVRAGEDHFCERQSVLKKIASPPFVYMYEYQC